jgi:hypothetical protein
MGDLSPFLDIYFFDTDVSDNHLLTSIVFPGLPKLCIKLHNHGNSFDDGQSAFFTLDVFCRFSPSGNEDAFYCRNYQLNIPFKPASAHHKQLTQDLIPVPVSLGPFLHNIHRSQVQHLFQ